MGARQNASATTRKADLFRTPRKLLLLMPLALMAFPEGTSGSYHTQMLPRDPDADKTIEELIAARGYPVESHEVVTADGYVLGLQRIPQGKRAPVADAATACGAEGEDVRRPAVLVMHGLGATAITWVANYDDQSLGFVLADAGYDVWLGNLRGSTLSRKHVRLSPDKDLKFWDFTFQDMIEHDVPSTIDYVLETTGLSKIAYIGHSQGTLVLFGLLSLNPAYNDKVTVFVALAPVTAPSQAAAVVSKPLVILAGKPAVQSVVLRLGEVMKSGIMWKKLANGPFRSEETLPAIKIILQVLFGPSVMTNWSRVHVYVHSVPAGTSWKNLLHFAQVVRTDQFCKYDYGAEKNKKTYGQTSPPCYPLEKITAPVAIFWGDGDTLSQPADIDKIRARVPSIVVDERVGSGPFNHVDFAFGIDAKGILHDRIVEVMHRYDDFCGPR
ncbi:gastric triacylglycerol lipase-like [Haemaphysalis longicornis]